MLRGNCIVGQSGGPTSVINSTLAGIIEEAKRSSAINVIYGALHGIEGVIQDKLINLNEIFDSESQIDLLRRTPSTYLGSCRYSLADKDNSVYEKIFSIFKKYNISYFFYIGGNDSMDTVNRLSQYAHSIGSSVNIIGIPKTIDNDIAITDHCPGFGSSAKYIATCIRELARDTQIYNRNTVTIVEIMGRNAGWLTASAALARSEGESCPHLVYLPEFEFSMDRFISDVQNALKLHRNIIVAVSEGIKMNGKYICESSMIGEVDVFGHKPLSGASRVLASVLLQETGVKVRAMELSLIQRAGIHLSSYTDWQEAYDIGAKAVQFAVDGQTAKMMYFYRNSNSPYDVEIRSADVNEVANVEKLVPKEWISEDGNDVKKELIDYITPLIQGEVNLVFNNGLPVFLKRGK